MLKSKNLNLRRKIMLYKTMIRPIITCGINVWYDAAKTNRKSIHVVQKKVLRIIKNAPRYLRNQKLHEELHMNTIREFVREIERQTVE